jgi:hypothetical protein
MTGTTPKSVFTLDIESQTYKPAAHNLSAGEAVERFNSDQSAKIVDQSERHRNPDPLKCRACKKTAEELTAKHAESASGSEHADEEALAAQEGEGD